MTGGTLDHSQITQNIYAALRPRLNGTDLPGVVSPAS